MKTLIALAIAATVFAAPVLAADRPAADNDNQPTVSMTKPKHPKKPKADKEKYLIIKLEEALITSY